MTIINCDYPLNMEHYDHTSVEKSIQTMAMSKFSQYSADLPPSVHKNPHSFRFQGEEEGQGGWA
jgi:hypothetical protein